MFPTRIKFWLRTSLCWCVYTYAHMPVASVLVACPNNEETSAMQTNKVYVTHSVNYLLESPDGLNCLAKLA